MFSRPRHPSDRCARHRRRRGRHPLHHPAGTGMRLISLAATQFACSQDMRANLDEAKGLVREAAVEGANVVLVQELFETPYFCQDQSADYFALAKPYEDNP